MALGPQILLLQPPRMHRALSIMVKLDFFPPPFTTLSCPCHKEVEDKLPREAAEFGKLPLALGGEAVWEEGKVSREGEEVKWWGNLEAGPGVTVR